MANWQYFDHVRTSHLPGVKSGEYQFAQIEHIDMHEATVQFSIYT